MKKTTAIKLVSILFLLPGLVFDLFMCFVFMMPEWAKVYYGSLPERIVNEMPAIFKIPFWLSAIVCVPVAGLISVALVVCSVGICAYLFMGLFLSVVSIPFTGKIKWVTLGDTDGTDKNRL